jgi:hypothetical protein
VPLPDGRGRGEAAGGGGGCGGPEVPRAERPPTSASAGEQLFCFGLRECCFFPRLRQRPYHLARGSARPYPES